MRLCEIYGVSRSGFYDWVKRTKSNRDKQDQHLSERIQEIYRDHKGRYGAPRIHQTLKREGVRCGRKRVARLMKQQSLKARVARIYRRAPSHKAFYIRENLLIGKGKPSAQNQLWVGDVTYLKVGYRHYFLAAVLDVHTRKILGWSLDKTRTVDLTLSALKQASRIYRPATGVIFHSDRGAEYTAIRYQSELRSLGMVSSMNRPGQCTDNAYMESFWHSLKAEALHGCQFETEEQLKRAVKEYISYYNVRRLHSGLGYTTPEQYEKLAA